MINLSFVNICFLKIMNLKIDYKNVIFKIILCYFIYLTGCVGTPTDNSPQNYENAERGDVLVLCEGLQGYDNSTLALIKSSSGTVIPDYFKVANRGEFLGDIANDMILKGDTAIIALSTSSLIRLIDIPSGQKITDISLPENCTPRHLAIINDSLMCVSCLLRNSVYFFSTNNNNESFEIEVGPQPEGIAYTNNLLFAANSAYGDFNYMHPDAETVSLVSIANKNELKKIKAGTNCMEVLINPANNMLYSAYYHLPSAEDSTGGIIEYDLTSFEKKRHWKVRARSICTSSNGDSLLFISQQPKGSSMKEESGIHSLNLKNGEITKLINNPKKTDIWYGMSVSPFDDSIWICNSKNHIANGEILVYKTHNYSTPEIKFDVLLNPNKVVFIR